MALPLIAYGIAAAVGGLWAKTRVKNYLDPTDPDKFEGRMRQLSEVLRDRENASDWSGNDGIVASRLVQELEPTVKMDLIRSGMEPEVLRETLRRLQAARVEKHRENPEDLGFATILASPFREKSLLGSLDVFADAPARVVDQGVSLVEGEATTLGNFVADRLPGEGMIDTIISGTLDAGKVMFLDPLIIGGKAGKTARLLRTPGQKAARWFGPDAVNKIDDLITPRTWKWAEQVAEMKSTTRIMDWGRVSGAPLEEAFARKLAALDNPEDIITAFRETPGFGYKTIPQAPFLGKQRLDGRAFVKRMPFLRPFQRTWDTKVSLYHEDLTDDLVRVGEFAYGATEKGGKQAAGAVRDAVDKVLESEGRDRVRAIESFFEDALVVMSKRKGMPEEFGREVLKKMKEDGRLGFTQEAFGGALIGAPERVLLETQTAYTVTLPSYWDMVKVAAEMNGAAKKYGLKAVIAADDFVGALEAPIRRYWLANPASQARNIIEEMTALSSDPELRRHYLRALKDKMLGMLPRAIAPGRVIDDGAKLSLITGDADEAAWLAERAEKVSLPERARALRAIQKQAKFDGPIQHDVRKALTDEGAWDGHVWTYMSRTDPGYLPALHHVINKQILGDRVSQMLLAYWDEPDEIARVIDDWFKTPEGAAYLRLMPADSLKVERVVVDTPLPKASYYHGSSKMLPAELDRWAGRSADNLLGPGLYLTDDADVARTYQKKGAVAGSERGFVHGFEIPKGARLIDAEAAIPDDVASVWRIAADRLEAAQYVDFDPADLAKLREAIESKTSTATLYRHYKNLLDGVNKHEVDEFLELIREDLEALGYHGYRYKGGARTGGKAHNPVVLFEPSSAKRMFGVPGRQAKTTASARAMVEDNRKLIEKIIPPSLLEEARTGSISFESLKAARDVPLTTYGPGLVNDTANSTALFGRWQQAGRISNKIFGISGRVTDAVGRSKAFDAFYPAELKRITDLAGEAGAIGKTVSMEEIEQQAFANTIRKVLANVDHPGNRTRFDYWAKTWIPFVDAQVRFWKRWGKRAIDNPAYVEKRRLLLDAGMDIGFLDEDDNGNISVGLPLTAPLAAKLLGAPRALVDDIPLTIDRKAEGGLQELGKAVIPAAMPFGVDILPGFGPVMKMTVGTIAKNRPSLSWLEGAIFGKGGIARKGDIDPNEPLESEIIGGVMAGWHSTLWKYITHRDRDVVFASSFKDALAVQAYLGNDISDPKVQAKARNQARSLFLVKGLMQFFSPYTPSKMPFGREIADDWSEMRTKYGPEIGTVKFLEKWGDDAFAFTVPKSKATGGAALAISAEAERFYRAHPKFFKDHPLVAGYFTRDLEGEYDPEVQRRQTRRGQREYLEPQDWIADAMYRQGNKAYYEQIRPQYEAFLAQGADRKAAQDWLENKRLEIDQKYPGWLQTWAGWSARQNKRDASVRALIDAMGDDAVKDTPTAKASMEWLDTYARVLNEVRRRGYETFRSDDLAGVRSALAQEARSIMDRYRSRGFESIYQYMFQNELEEYD